MIIIILTIIFMIELSDIIHPFKLDQSILWNWLKSAIWGKGTIFGFMETRRVGKLEEIGLAQLSGRADLLLQP